MQIITDDETRNALWRMAIENNAQALRDSPDITRVYLNRIISPYDIVTCYDRGESIAELVKWRD